LSQNKCHPFQKCGVNTNIKRFGSTFFKGGKG